MLRCVVKNEDLSSRYALFLNYQAFSNIHVYEDYWYCIKIAWKITCVEDLQNELFQKKVTLRNSLRGSGFYGNPTFEVLGHSFPFRFYVPHSQSYNEPLKLSMVAWHVWKRVQKYWKTFILNSKSVDETLECMIILIKALELQNQVVPLVFIFFLLKIGLNFASTLETRMGKLRRYRSDVLGFFNLSYFLPFLLLTVHVLLFTFDCPLSMINHCRFI